MCVCGVWMCVGTAVCVQRDMMCSGGTAAAAHAHADESSAGMLQLVVSCCVCCVYCIVYVAFRFLFTFF